jgi:hypothetical protein
MVLRSVIFVLVAESCKRQGRGLGFAYLYFDKIYEI